MNARPASTPRLLALVLLAPLLIAPLGACDSGEPPQEVAVVATKSDAEVPTWLSPTDGMEPALWLARREPGQAATGAAARGDHLRHSLARARETFIEDPRMIANRTVQLGQMLAEAGKPESYEALLDGLEAAAAPTRRKQLYGELCQHYYNTRQQGLDRSHTLARLAERYAAQPAVPDAAP